MKRVTWLAFAFIALLVGAGSVRAATCEDVRSLSRSEQEYWAKRLNLTTAQRDQI
jgi:Spy/CpxP family protein refolding chaperone